MNPLFFHLKLIADGVNHIIPRKNPGIPGNKFFPEKDPRIPGITFVARKKSAWVAGNRDFQKTFHEFREVVPLPLLPPPTLPTHTNHKNLKKHIGLRGAKMFLVI